ncbi:uncharacterized protein QC763_0032230 [Podospora pseudopauciseta]|uniref:Uncharacterized protein n=2 Tax=Podospora TaxID=5144 RepID=A0ABR0HMU0_9PEZI|nr:hypothetical protein QC763_0032230 [Podospora pseudopauciseta]KAK4679279.1 hypothetical protein QC764_0033120 [Podospora pseudoanserina]
MRNQGLGLVFRGKHVNGHVEKTVKIWRDYRPSPVARALPLQRASVSAFRGLAFCASPTSITTHTSSCRRHPSQPHGLTNA